MNHADYCHFSLAPTIITTSPTVTQRDSSKGKSNLKFPSEKLKSNDSSANTPDNNVKNSGEAGRSGARSPPAPSSLRASHVSFEEPGRLSTTSAQSSGIRGHYDASNNSASLIGTRLSESSKSDASSGDNGVYRFPSRNGATSNTHSLFRFPRLKKSRAPLFPLPAKATPIRKQVVQPDSQKHNNSLEHNRDQLSPLPSPTHSSSGFYTPPTGSTAPTLFRKDSVTSAHSGRSLPSVNRKAVRGRSSTMNSLADIRHAPHQPSPPSRNSTYTAPRKSFGDFFNFSHRLRQNSELPGPGDPSPMPGAPATPASMNSKPNSFSMPREQITYPAREEGDTPTTYLERLHGAVRRGLIAAGLSRYADEFYAAALRKYMRGFAFFGDPIDIAIRKLLMEVELPKETQHIDRVIQSFADRYHECNPGIFASAGASPGKNT